MSVKEFKLRMMTFWIWTGPEPDQNASLSFLTGSPHFGTLFETFIVTDVLKRFLRSGQLPSLYYLRTRDGLEVDLVIDYGQKLHLLEVKSSMTILPKHAASLIRIARDVGPLLRRGIVVSQAPRNFQLHERVYNCNWKDLLAL